MASACRRGCAASKLTVADTTALAGLRRTKVLAVSVATSIGSLKAASPRVAALTPVAPLAGVTLVTVGGVVSAAV